MTWAKIKRFSHGTKGSIVLKVLFRCTNLHSMQRQILSEQLYAQRNKRHIIFSSYFGVPFLQVQFVAQPEEQKSF